MAARRGILRAAALLLGLLLAAVAGLAVFLQLDKTHVFYEVRGTYRGAATLKSWEAGSSRLRLIELRNHRREGVATAYLRTPRELAGDYRILLTYAGQGTGRRILALIPERDDLVLVSLQYPYQPPRGLLPRLRWPYDLRRAAFRTVAGGMLAVSHLSVAEGLEPHRLTVLGASLGSAFAVLHGALDPRVPRVVVIHGGGDFPAVVAAIQRRRGKPWLARPTAWVAALLVDSFDPVHYAGRIAPRELVVLATRRDRYFPVESIEALYARAREPKRILWTETDHVRSHRPDLAEEIVRQIETYLARPEARAPAAVPEG